MRLKSMVAVRHSTKLLIMLGALGNRDRVVLTDLKASSSKARIPLTT